MKSKYVEPCMRINHYTEYNTCKELKHIVDSVGTFNVYCI